MPSLIHPEDIRKLSDSLREYQKGNIGLTLVNTEESYNNYETINMMRYEKQTNRDDTHMTSMKIVQFSRPPTPLSICVQNYFTPLTLDVQFQTNPYPSPGDNQSFKRKHNQRITIICYQVLPSGPLPFSV